MTFDRVVEVEELLSRDEAREGELWCWYRDIPNGPSYAEVDARVIRRWLRTKIMRADLRKVLTAQLALLDQISTGVRSEGAPASGRTVGVGSPDTERTTGVYVYALPW